MYVYMPNLSGLTAAPIQPSTVTLSIDPGLAAALALALQGGYTYAELSFDDVTEFVRVSNVVGATVSIVRARDGTTAMAFPAGAMLSVELIPSAIEAIIVQANLAPTVVSSIHPALQVLGSGPAFTLNLDTAMLALPPPASDPIASGLSVDAGGIVQVVVDSDGLSFTVSVQEPLFSGDSNISVSGSWPLYNLSFTGAPGNPGTVEQIAAGTGLTVTGSPTVSPTLELTNTAVVAGDYAGSQIDSKGRTTGMPVPPGPTSGPICELLVAGTPHAVAAVSLERTAGAGWRTTLDIARASTAQDGFGLIKLASPSVSHSNDPANEIDAVSPAGLNAALAAFAPKVSGAFNGFSVGEPPAAYSVVGAVASGALVAGERYIIMGFAAFHDSVTPSGEPEVAVALFVNNTLAAGTRIAKGACQFTAAAHGTVGPCTVELRHTVLVGTTVLNSCQIFMLKAAD